MADFFCSFFHSRSLTTNSQIFFPPKPFVLTIPHSLNPGTRRRKRKPLHLTLLSEHKSSTPSSSPDFDIISIHEHSDGSLLFRFGDPSKIAENVKLAEPKVLEEIKKESQEGFSTVNVLDGDIKREVIVKKLDKEDRFSRSTEVANKGNESVSIVETESKSCEKLSEDSKRVELAMSEANPTGISNESISDVEKENESGEKLSEDSKRFELASNEANPIGISNESISDVEKENESGEKLSEDSKRFELASNEANPIGISNESISNVEKENVSSERLSKDSKNVELAINEANTIDISNETISVVEKENESTEKLSEDSKNVELPVSSTDVKDSSPHSEDTKDNSGTSADIESVGYVEKGSSEKHEDEIPPLVSVTVLDESSTVDNSSGTAESSEEKIGGEMTLQSIHLKLNPVIDVIDDIVTEEIVAATNLSANSHSMEAGNGIEIVEDGKGNDRSEVTPVSPRLELSLNLSPDNEDQNLEIGMPAKIAEDGNSSDINVEATFPFTEVAINFSADSMDRNSEVIVDFSEDSKDQNSEAGNGMPCKTVEHGSQSDMIEVMPVSPQLEADPILDEEADNEFMEESAVADRNESIMMLNNSQKSLLEPRTDNDHSLRNCDIEEASGCEVTQLKSVENRIKADFVLSSGAALLPHPSKVLTGAEDAYFISGQTWLGVADGVSQWSLEGVNPGVYARELIKKCENIVADCTGDSVNNPVEVLTSSVARTQCPGSSTVLIAHFDGEALQVANIGDSGFIILRHGSVYKKSSPMLHEFHFPVQIERGDDPSYLTEEYRVDLEEGDVIITATDGLFDNLYDQGISSIVLASLNSDKQLEEIAELLATQAQEVGRSASARCPFADAAEAAGYVGYSGGKLDDVAVIVSVVRRQ